MSARRGWANVLRRVLVWAVVAAAVVYALQGGEWGTDDILAQRSRAKRLRASIDTLRREVDSLERVKKAVLTDPEVQERIAREEFGMVLGDKELLYRFAEPKDTSGRGR
ncbi:MAG TPA: septum formation initiator family protein [Gemmatimonadaceae bacterium]|jgi:cell division protein FtsB|nr:septum formation initiator family protein [Gemmatimonadaceae bacterium]